MNEATYQRTAFIAMMAFFVVAPLFIYPVFLMKVLCFALFACAFNLLIGFGGLLSFGHAMFLGMAGYVAAYTAKSGVQIAALKVFGATIPLGIHIPPLPFELALLTAVAVTAILHVVTGAAL